jgi:hypothetical protein
VITSFLLALWLAGQSPQAEFPASWRNTPERLARYLLEQREFEPFTGTFTVRSVSNSSAQGQLWRVYVGPGYNLRIEFLKGTDPTTSRVGQVWGRNSGGYWEMLSEYELRYALVDVAVVPPVGDFGRPSWPGIVQGDALCQFFLGHGQLRPTPIPRLVRAQREGELLRARLENVTPAGPWMSEVIWRMHEGEWFLVSSEATSGFMRGKKTEYADYRRFEGRWVPRRISFSCGEPLTSRPTGARDSDSEDYELLELKSMPISQEFIDLFYPPHPGTNDYRKIVSVESVGDAR